MINTSYLFVENSKNDQKIYCDMDGVLTDFDKQAKSVDSNIFNLKPEIMWKKIANGGVRFWSNMYWTQDGQLLWNYIKRFNPKILTALPGLSDTDPNTINATKGKKIWIKQNLGSNVLKNLILTTSNKKKKYAKPDIILIDDRKKLINQWKEKGGNGILHNNAKDTIQVLQKINF